jgi:NitT/TauT family transport system permease protein
MKNRFVLSVCSVAVLVLAWHAATALGWINALFLPTPLEVGQTLWQQLFVTGEIVPDVWATLWRTLAGYLAGAAMGVFLGILMGYSARAYVSLEFLVDFFRSIPSTTLFPLFLLFFGIGDEAKVAVAIWACTFVVLVNTMYGVHHASKLRVMVAKTMKASRFDMLRKVVLPDALPHVFAGLRIALSLALIVIVMTEMFIGTTVGLGHRIIDAQLVYRVPEVYAAIILAGVTGYLLNRVFLRVERRSVHWSGR